jgi:hypothetical protein
MPSAISRPPISRRQCLLEREARRARSWIRFQIDGGGAGMAAIERRMFDEAPQPIIVAQFATQPQPEIAGVRIHESWREATIAAVAMNELQAFDTALPGLLNEMDQWQPADIVGMKAVKIDLDHAHADTSTGSSQSSISSNDAL